MRYTTIQITQETRERLSKLKTSERDTYDELLTVLLDIIPSKDDEGEYTEEFKASLIRSLSDIKRGRLHSIQEVRKMLGL